MNKKIKYKTDTMHTRFFENEFGETITITVNKSNIQTFRQEPAVGIDIDVKSGKIKIMSATLTKDEALVLAKSILRSFD